MEIGSQTKTTQNNCILGIIAGIRTFLGEHLATTRKFSHNKGISCVSAAPLATPQFILEQNYTLPLFYIQRTAHPNPPLGMKQIPFPLYNEGGSGRKRRPHWTSYKYAQKRRDEPQCTIKIKYLN